MHRVFKAAQGLAVALSILVPQAVLAQAVPVPADDGAGFETTLDRLGLSPETLSPGGYEILARCCKTCSKGKACGDSCISRSKSCHKGPGCACDG